VSNFFIDDDFRYFVNFVIVVRVVINVINVIIVIIVSIVSVVIFHDHVIAYANLKIFMEIKELQEKGFSSFFMAR